MRDTLKISQLIKSLQRALKTQGDLDVLVDTEALHFDCHYARVESCGCESKKFWKFTGLEPFFELSLNMQDGHYCNCKRHLCKSCPVIGGKDATRLIKAMKDVKPVSKTKYKHAKKLYNKVNENSKA
jgi:hypothetical protein